MTDSLKTEVPEISDVSQDPHDKVKVLMIVKKLKTFYPLMMNADQSKIESVEKVELVEVGKTNVSHNSNDKNKAHISRVGKDILIKSLFRFTF